MLFEADHTVIPTFSTVDDARAIGLAVDEQEEVVTDQFHVIQSLFDRHVTRREDLAPDNDGRIVVVAWLGFRSLRRDRTGRNALDNLGTRGSDIDYRESDSACFSQGRGAVMSTMNFLAIAGLADSLDELSHCQIEGNILI